MNLDEIKELIALMRKHRISEIDLEQKGSKIRIVTEPARTQTAEAVSVTPMAAPYFITPAPGDMAKLSGSAASHGPDNPKTPEAHPTKETQKESLPSNMVEIRSPMPGTFYRAPAPDAPPYVELGTAITKDTVLCIIEAMKLMNEIKGESHGRIVKILVENGHPVEYNQPLFLVEPA